MARYRNKLVYDIQLVKLEMIETICLCPKILVKSREGGRGTDISTLLGGQN